MTLKRRRMSTGCGWQHTYHLGISVLTLSSIPKKQDFQDSLKLFAAQNFGAHVSINHFSH